MYCYAPMFRASANRISEQWINANTQSKRSVETPRGNARTPLGQAVVYREHKRAAQHKQPQQEQKRGAKQELIEGYARDAHRLPKVRFLGTTFDNLRIGGRAIEIDLETAMFEHGGITLQTVRSDDNRNDSQSRDSLRGSLVKTIGGSLSGASHNSVTLLGFGTLFLSEFLLDEDSYQLKMIRHVTSSGW